MQQPAGPGWRSSAWLLSPKLSNPHWCVVQFTSFEISRTWVNALKFGLRSMVPATHGQRDPLKSMRLYNVKVISTDIFGTKRATGDPRVSKRPDFQGLFSYLRGSHGLSACGVRCITPYGDNKKQTFCFRFLILCHLSKSFYLNLYCNIWIII